MPLAIEILKSSFYTTNQVPGNMAIVNQIRSAYGAIINEACSSANARLDSYILEALFFIESKGNPNAANGQAYGIGQLDPKTASNIPFWLKKRAKIMTDSQEAKIYQLFGQNLADCLLNLKWDNAPSKCSGAADSTNLITKQQLLNPEINIWLSSMYMDYLVDKYSEGGIIGIGNPTKVRMDKIIVHYNAGQGNANKVPKSLTPTDTVSFVKNNISNTTSDYILKFIGTNGLIDSITRTL
ncbi:hypothetical protein SAMN04515674_101523 [Pseudarcicella hirudinis]|uniref:Transglycosylase SLT domain-containing protein n=1 Tax=Pseudarcicella hirudinis TaxID=1079859 RepID=A0A1I5MZH4_9BACT|nr:lytic transglycosylase domain-containing protein [Pseudarcicella hirudinis]SFP14880.1 hypothetical protein SAMN04515674_101523 [Pseudarcicella hirudinis]